jgi:hypothetical protein
LNFQRFPVRFRPVTIRRATILLAALTLAATNAPDSRIRAYRQCTVEADLNFSRRWDQRCLELGNRPECDLLQNQMSDLYAGQLAARRECLRRVRGTGPTQAWEIQEAKALNASPAFAGARIQKMELWEWLLGTIIISACIVGIINLLRRKAE